MPFLSLFIMSFSFSRKFPLPFKRKQKKKWCCWIKTGSIVCLIFLQCRFQIPEAPWLGSIHLWKSLVLRMRLCLVTEARPQAGESLWVCGAMGKHSDLRCQHWRLWAGRGGAREIRTPFGCSRATLNREWREKKTGAAVSLPEAEVMSGPEMLLAAGILTGLSRSFDSAGAAG